MMFRRITTRIRKYKRIYRLLYRIYLIFIPVPVGLATKMRLIIMGFKPSKALMYDLKNYKIQDYFPEIRPVKIHGTGKMLGDLNEEFAIIPQCKIIGNSMLRHYISVPENLAYLDNGFLYPLNKEWHKYYGNIKEFLQSGYSGDFFFKPLREYGGKGAFKLSMNSNSVTYNGNTLSTGELELKLGRLKQYIIQKVIKQDEFGSNLFPESINTMRLVTMVDPDTHEPFIPWGDYRIGVKASAPVDNISAGGFMSPIDIDTGVLGKGLRIDNHKLIQYTHHPDTGNKIEGLIIPDWTSIKHDIINVAREFPYLRFLSWDVVVSNNKITVIEFGNGTGIDLVQVHLPLLSNPKVTRFFQHHKVTHNWE